MERLRELEKETLRVFLSAIPTEFRDPRDRLMTEDEKKYHRFLSWLEKYTIEIGTRLRNSSSRSQMSAVGDILISATVVEARSNLVARSTVILRLDDDYKSTINDFQRHELLCSEFLFHYRRLSSVHSCCYKEVMEEYTAFTDLWKTIKAKARRTLSSIPQLIGDIDSILDALECFLYVSSNEIKYLQSTQNGFPVIPPVSMPDSLGRTAVHQWLDEVKPFHDNNDWMCAFKKIIGHAIGDLDDQDFLGRTLLHITCQQGWYTGTAWLLQQGASAQLVTGYESLPLHYAAANGSNLICRLLLAYRSKFNIHERDRAALKALDYAETYCFMDVIDILYDESIDGDDEIDISSITSDISFTANVSPATLITKPNEVIRSIIAVIEYVLSEDRYCDEYGVQLVSAVIQKLQLHLDWRYDVPNELRYISSIRTVFKLEEELLKASNTPRTSTPSASHAMLTAMCYAANQTGSLIFEPQELETVENLMIYMAEPLSLVTHKQCFDVE
jgi:hypothetical protein